jgi:hypothetical protein
MKLTQTNQSFSLFFLLLLVFISGCGDAGSTDSSGEGALFSEAEEKIFKDISKIIEDLPPPSIVPTTMQELGAEYDEALTNDLSRLDEYLVENNKAALNLGVYAADIGYLIAYDQVQASMDHITACQKIAENLGVATAFDLELIQKFEASMDDHEKMITLFNETIITTEKRLGDSDQLENAGLVLTGSFIEGLYLAVTVIDNYHKSNKSAESDQLLEPLVKLVLEQEQVLIDIISLLKDIPPNSKLNRMIAELNVLKLLYDGDLADIEKEMAENADLVITEEMLFDINLEITRIRNDITK